MDDLAVIEQRERELVFETFVEEDAWHIGCLLRAWAVERGWPICIEVRLFDRTLFYAMLPKATPNNAEWVRRKRNVVARFHRSSLLVGLGLDKASCTLNARYGVDIGDFAASGGSLPLFLRGCAGAIGSVTVSGLSDRDDHAIVTKAIATRLGLLWESEIDLPT